MSGSQRFKESLLAQIARAELIPGERLDSERELARSFELSRSTVNQVLSELAAQGYLIREPRKQAKIANLFDAQFAAQVSGLSQNPKELVPVFELRAALEGEAAFYCAQRASQDQLDTIALEYAAMVKRNQGETTLTKAKADLRFHTLIAQCSHNLPVVSFSQLFYERFFNAIFTALDMTLRQHGKYPEGIRGQHAALFKAIKRRDAQQAREIAKSHVLYTCAHYRDSFRAS